MISYILPIIFRHGVGCEQTQGHEGIAAAVKGVVLGHVDFIERGLGRIPSETEQRDAVYEHLSFWWITAVFELQG